MVWRFGGRLMGFEQAPPTDGSLVQQLKYAQESGAMRHHAYTRRMCHRWGFYRLQEVCPHAIPGVLMKHVDQPWSDGMMHRDGG